MGFSQVSVLTNASDEKMVQWAMDGSGKLPSPLLLYVDKARSGGDFVNIAGPLEDVCIYVDPEPWNWNKDKNSFYRVRYEHPSGTWVESEPEQANGTWSREDFLHARELFRKECVRMRKVGIPGLLFKRREWGSPCPRCADFDTNQPADGQCQICYGTGIEHGYYRPIPLTVDLTLGPVARTESEVGVMQPTVIVGRAMHYPMITSFDMWVSSTSNERYTIRQIQNVASLRGRPLVAQLELRTIPQTDVRYRLEDPVVVPAPGEPGFGWDQLNVV